jgi:hypothetical protein
VHGFLFLLGEVPRVKTVIETTTGKQFFMCATFDDFTLFEHDNLIGSLDRGETMRDNERGPSLHQSLQRFLNETFGFVIE